MLLSDLVLGLPVKGHVPAATAVDAITVDEREVRPGCLYVAQRGYYGDGHDRIEAALRAGASALLVRDETRIPSGAAVPALVADESPTLLGELSARFYRAPTHELAVYGVTGTNGKTSVTYLLEHILAALGERPAVLGTVSYRFEELSHPACNTTPDSLFVHRFARKALDAGARSLVLEVSSHALALGRTAAVRFSRVGFTNLSHEHLDFHHTLEEYGQTKQRLFTDGLRSALSAGSRPLAAALVTEPVGWAMLAATAPAVRRLAVSVGPSAGPASGADGGGESLGVDAGGTVVPTLGSFRRVSIEVVEPRGLAGYRFRLRTERGAWEGQTTLLGRHNLANIALAIALAAGDDDDRCAAAVAALASFGGIPGRLEPAASVDAAARAVFVDYAHTPAAVGRALETFDEVGARPITIVLGCGGDRDPSKRDPMARAARLGADEVIFTSDNPRSEEPDAIVAPMLAACRAPEPQARARHVHCELDRAVAIERAIVASGAGPVLIAGKGHERYQERKGRRYRFDDREEARRALVAHALGCRADEVTLWCGWAERRIAAACGPNVVPAVGPSVDLPARALRLEPDPTTASARLSRSPLTLLARSGWPPEREARGSRTATFVAREPWDAVAVLGRAVVAEAAVRLAGLWIIGVESSADREQRLELAPEDETETSLRSDPFRRVARALALACPEEAARALRFERTAAARDGSPWSSALVAIACLTAADRGLLVELPPRSASAGRDPAPEVSTMASARPVEPDLTIGPARALSLDRDGWGALLERARELARRRFEAGVEPRPVPVPDSLRLGS